MRLSCANHRLPSGLAVIIGSVGYMILSGLRMATRRALQASRANDIALSICGTRGRWRVALHARRTGPVVQADLSRNMRATARSVALLSILLTGNARAQTSSSEMVDKGIQLRREHRDAEALELFRQAYQRNPAPRVKAQIGLAEQALAQWVEAERDLGQALAAGQDPWIADHAEALKAALAAIQQHLASLSIETNAAGAELWLNGLPAGQLPVAPLRVVAGTVNVEIRSKDFETLRKSIAVEPGKSLTERIVLTTPAAPAPPAEGAPAEERRPDTPPPTMRFFAWGTLSAAGAFLGSAVVAEFMREYNANRYNDDGLCFQPGLGSRDKQCGAYRGRAEAAQTIETIGYVAAGALGVASVVLFLTGPTSPNSKSTAIRIDAHTDGLDVTWSGKF